MREEMPRATFKAWGASPNISTFRCPICSRIICRRRTETLETSAAWILALRARERRAEFPGLILYANYLSPEDNSRPGRRAALLNQFFEACIFLFRPNQFPWLQGIPQLLPNVANISPLAIESSFFVFGGLEMNLGFLLGSDPGPDPAAAIPGGIPSDLAFA
jgi:hypothetical protein